MSIYRCGYMYVHMYIKYTPQQAMILQTTLYFSWALGADVTEASHPRCSLVYLACIVPSVSVSPLVQKLRAQGPSSPLCPSPIIVWYSAQTSCPFACLPEDPACSRGFTEQILEPKLGVLVGATLNLAFVCQGC